MSECNAIPLCCAWLRCKVKPSSNINTTFHQHAESDVWMMIKRATVLQFLGWGWCLAPTYYHRAFWHAENHWHSSFYLSTCLCFYLPLPGCLSSTFNNASSFWQLRLPLRVSHQKTVKLKASPNLILMLLHKWATQTYCRHVRVLLFQKRFSEVKVTTFLLHIFSPPSFENVLVRMGYAQWREPAETSLIAPNLSGRIIISRKFPTVSSWEIVKNHLVVDANEPLWTPFYVCRCLWLSITFKILRV